MDIKDALGFGKVLPMDKLIDIFSKAIGRVTKSHFDKKDIDTDAYRIKRIAEARAEEMKIIANAVKDNFQITGGIEYKEEKIAISSPKMIPNEIPEAFPINLTLAERTQERITYQEAKKQLNIESIAAVAAEELKNEPQVTDEPIDEDWTTRFFKIAEDISNEEMQALWGKILAGEIKQPKTFSLRTLEFLRNLSQKEANTFKKIADFAFKFGNENFLFRSDKEDFLRYSYNITYSEIALLVEIGLIQPGFTQVYQLLQNEFDVERVFTSGDIIIVTYVKATTPTINIPVHIFTNAGNELLKLIKSQPPFDYLQAIAKSIKNENVDVKYGYISKVEGDTIYYNSPLLEFV